MESLRLVAISIGPNMRPHFQDFICRFFTSRFSDGVVQLQLGAAQWLAGEGRFAETLHDYESMSRTTSVKAEERVGGETKHLV